jgi:hypothetical protein
VEGPFYQKKCTLNAQETISKYGALCFSASKGEINTPPTKGEGKMEGKGKRAGNIRNSKLAQLKA